MEAKATWKSGLSFDGTASSGFVLPMGSSIESGGAEDGFRPMELLAIGLVGCTGMDVISTLSPARRLIQKRLSGRWSFLKPSIVRLKPCWARLPKSGI
jgi:uncharacterized OsmC-like protein